MYKIEFYQNQKGESPFADFIKILRDKSEKSKDCRINYHKILAYLDMLQEMGTRMGEPVVKHLDGEIWELRPLKHRVLFAYYKDDTFIILHYFTKKTKKTPRKELEQAKHNLKDLMEREGFL